MIHAIDLCCGAGGWATAARGLPVSWRAVADLDPICLEVWRLNHGAAHPDCARVEADLSTDAGIDAVRRAVAGQPVDVVVGGIPCEHVSPLRGATPLRNGQLESWHSLIDYVLALAFELRPRAWCIEDVINIEPHLTAPIELGRSVPFRRIDAADFGPQRRLRTYIGRFPDPEPDPARAAATLADCLLPGPHRGLLFPERYQAFARGRDAARVGNDRVRALDPADKCPTVFAALTRGDRQRRCWCVREGGAVRCLSISELARAQGFPPDYLFAAQHSRMEAMVGRAIQVDLGRAIWRAIVAEARGPERRADREEAPVLSGD